MKSGQHEMYRTGAALIGAASRKIDAGRRGSSISCCSSASSASLGSVHVGGTCWCGMQPTLHGGVELGPEGVRWRLGRQLFERLLLVRIRVGFTACDAVCCQPSIQVRRPVLLARARLTITPPSSTAVAALRR